jgi:hypothetical protein
LAEGAAHEHGSSSQIEAAIRIEIDRACEKFRPTAHARKKAL